MRLRADRPFVLVATYLEKQLGMTRVFSLYEDRIVIRTSRLLGVQSETPVRLNHLSTDWSVVRKKSTVLGNEFAVFAFNLIFATVALYSNFEGSALKTLAAWLCIALSVASFVPMMAALRRVEFYSFRDVYRPEVSLFAIARRGPDSGQFEEFASKVRQQIQLTRARRLPK